VPSHEESVELLKARGLVPLFPLPNIVLFPRAALPLHIFEPRYRRMTEDALRSDRLIAMALLKPGWEERYHGNPEVHPIACAGVIEDEATLPDGRFNIRLRGLARVEILGFVRETPYRMAAIRVLEDANAEDGPAVEDDKRRLLAACASLLQEISGRPAPPLAIEGEVPFAAAVNTLCQTLTMEPESRQSLLTMDDVRERCRALIDLLNSRWQEISLRQATREPAPEGDVN